MLYDLWAHVRPAPCTVTQNDSPFVGADLLRDWLGPTHLGGQFFSFVSFSTLGHALLFSKSSVHCIDLVSVLHVHAFRTACVLRYIFVHCIGIIFLYCFSSYVYPFFLVYGCALLLCPYAHCIRHSPVLQVYTICTACILLCAKKL